jgi:hypothetical protein
MFGLKKIATVAVLAAALGLTVGTLPASQAAAAVIDFGNHPGSYSPYTEDGFSFGPTVQLDNSGGNCPYADPACLKLNNATGGGYPSAVMTLQSGGMFDLLSFQFQFSGTGNPNTLTVSAAGYAPLTFTVGAGYAKDTDYTYYPVGGIFSNVSSVTFSSSTGGTVRIDTINASPVSTIPLPAAGFLLVGALGGLGLMGRRRKAA